MLPSNPPGSASTRASAGEPGSEQGRAFMEPSPAFIHRDMIITDRGRSTRILATKPPCESARYRHARFRVQTNRLIEFPGPASY
jgi:hypothetical protein